MAPAKRINRHTYCHVGGDSVRLRDSVAMPLGNDCTTCQRGEGARTATSVLIRLRQGLNGLAWRNGRTRCESRTSREGGTLTAKCACDKDPEETRGPENAFDSFPRGEGIVVRGRE